MKLSLQFCILLNIEGTMGYFLHLADYDAGGDNNDFTCKERNYP